MAVSQTPIVATSVLTVAISAFAAHWVNNGATAAAVDASMFGHLAATLDVKSAQKPSRPDADGAASDGSASDGSAIDGMATDGAPLEVDAEQADSATAAAATNPMSDRRIDMRCLQYPLSAA